MQISWGYRIAVMATQSLASCTAGAQAAHRLGTVDFPISCSAPAQREFNRGVALLHNMTYVEARQAFEKVAALDPSCAMAHWGTAMTLFQPLWPTRPQPDALARGFAEAQRARALDAHTAREKLFVESVAAFFADPSSPDYWRRVQHWESASHETFAAYPEDPEAAAFYALSLLAIAPSNPASRTIIDSAAGILLRVYQSHPEHPGAMHYLIHADDVPGREHDATDVLARYPALAPNNAHALHMPTHIYTRLGDWDRVIRGNILSEKAALHQGAGGHGELVSDEYPHAVEYLVYAYLQQGADAEAAREIARLREQPHIEPTFKTAFHLASTQARYALERRAWREAATITPREPAVVDWDKFGWPEAVSQFARGLGAAHVGALHAARSAEARIEQLEAASGRTGEDVFTRNIRMLRLELSAWIAHASGNEDSSIAWMREAAELEVSTPKHAVTPAPTLPAYELLGDLFMARHRPADALESYRRSLELYPRRFNSLLGVARAARALGDTATAAASYRSLLDVTRRGAQRAETREARDYVRGRSRSGSAL